VKQAKSDEYDQDIAGSLRVGDGALAGCTGYTMVGTINVR